MGGLRRSAVRGTAWSTLSTVLNRGLRFVITVVLARLLVPADFGLIAMAGIVMDVAELLNDLGLGAALIQRKTLERQHLSTCFWSNLVLGAGLWLVTWGIAPLIAAFYRTPQVQAVLPVMALNFLIAPLGSVPWVLLNRDLRFRELTIAQTIATVVRGGAALLLAWQGAGVWALVWGPLAGTATGCVVNWRFTHWRPAGGWSRRHFRELFRFGRNVFGGRLLGYFSANSDYLITGRIMGATTLGYYNFSYQIPHLAQTHVAPVVNRVLFPLLSRVQDDLPRFRRGYLESVRWVAAAAAPFIAGLLVTAPEFVTTVYGPRWAPVIGPLRILCVAGLAHAVTTSVWTVQQAMGRPDIELRWNMMTLPVILATLVFSARWGVHGIAGAMLALTLGFSCAIQHWTNRLIRLPWRDYLGAVGPVCAAATAMGLVVAGARVWLLGRGWSGWGLLGGEMALGIICYALALRLVAPAVWQDARHAWAHLRAAGPELAN